MSINIETTQLQLKTFEAEVFRAYQKDESTLKALCRVKTIAGTEHQFPKYGTLMAVERVVGTPLVSENQTTAKVSVNTTRYSVSTYSDIFLQNEVNFDDRAEAAYAVAAAANRKMDAVIIAALEAQRTAGYTNSVATGIGGTATNLNVAKIAKCAEIYDKSNIKGSDRNILVHSNNFHAFTQDIKVASSDYNSQKVLTTGSLGSYYGFNITKLGDIENENGLALASTIRHCYAIQKQALGFVVNMDMKVETNYVPTHGADLITCFFSCGSKVIEEKGIINVQCTDAANASV
ncbi:hypothetical protein UFOVP831_29 [uncultured Caudovirales phage]|uniref:Phage capsid n=1 Tax=uncultured Caudovirales phage TaxID=2100421 RepID=A0A6J5P342_9CAUD|nr:hypothetical protein UFOVP831_29 [uncultured Caudovirales phage]